MHYLPGFGGGAGRGEEEEEEAWRTSNGYAIHSQFQTQTASTNINLLLVKFKPVDSSILPYKMHTISDLYFVFLVFIINDALLPTLQPPSYNQRKL